MMCCCFLRSMRKHLTSISYITRTKRSGTCIIGHFEVERETGTEFCRIALWYCFRMRSPFLIGYYKVAQGAGSKFAPKLLQTGNYSCRVEIER